ncbi:MAG: peptidoglycan-binding domain-containing protein, partial [Pseudomonadota bacterium]
IQKMSTNPPSSPAPLAETIERVVPAEPTPAEVVVAEPAVPDLDQWLQQRRNVTGTTRAFETLFSLWNKRLDDTDVAACQQARALRLRCVADRSSIAELLILDRPAIMTLRDRSGEAHQVVLSASSDDTLTLSTGDDEITIPTGELSRFWFGEYLMLWQPPNNEVTSLRKGARGVAVLWLRQSLTAIMGQTAEPLDSDQFDDALETMVRDYQRSRLLTVDGLAGQRTQMMIIRDLGLKDVPSISRNDAAAVTATTGVN